jgi:hypothetical protein
LLDSYAYRDKEVVGVFVRFRAPLLGPNIWSIREKKINQMRLEEEQFPTNKKSRDLENESKYVSLAD